VDDQQVVRLGDGDDLQLDSPFVVSDEQQPVVQTILTRDDVRFSGILHRLQGTGLADAVLAGRGGEPDAPHLMIVSDTVRWGNRLLTARPAADVRFGPTRTWLLEGEAVAVPA
jgi:hypothetical protein